MDIVIHRNPSQPHQAEHAEWWRDGLKCHGIDLTVTSNIDLEADVHIVSGPHFAKDRWTGSKTILLDRAYYHDELSGLWKSMDWVSLGWMNSDGGRDFSIGSGRNAPEIKDHRNSGSSIFLADYNGEIERADEVRLHPESERPRDGLCEALRRHGVAIGYKTSALVIAGLEGLEVICKDSTNIMAQPNWLELLPYADWHYSEIQSGEAWEHLNAFSPKHSAS